MSFIISAWLSYIKSKVELANAAETKVIRIRFGVGGPSSATRGANIVASRPPKLQMPAAVPQKSVGNNFYRDR